jgi:hypothetical protein
VDVADMKEKGKKMAGNCAKWIKAHFDEIQFYTLESYYRGGDEVDDKYKDLTFAANIAYVRYEGTTPYFYFVKVGGALSSFLRPDVEALCLNAEICVVPSPRCRIPTSRRSSNATLRTVFCRLFLALLKLQFRD